MKLIPAPIHFFNFDARFCGSTIQGRRVTPFAHDVTCPVCRAKDAQQTAKAALPLIYEQKVSV